MHPARTGCRLALAALLVGVGGLSAACSSDPPLTYVALGDSYTAGPLIPTSDEAGGCYRSDHNYPTLLAASRDWAVTDVSCTGARTDALEQPQQTSIETVPAQFDAVTDTDPDIVTIGIGANDERISSTLLSLCAAAGEQDPDGSPCADADAAAPVDMTDKIATMEQNLVESYDRLRDLAPDATILALGYPQVVPETGTCRDLFPLAVDDYPWARVLNERLNDAVRDAAERAGIGFVDVWPMSAGHDICADDPWINGQQTTGEALAYHPFAAYEQAVADLVSEQVG